MFGNEIEAQIFAVAASLCRDVGRVGPSAATPAFVVLRRGRQRRDYNLSRRAGRRQPYGLGGGVGRGLGVSSPLGVGVGLGVAVAIAVAVAVGVNVAVAVAVAVGLAVGVGVGVLPPDGNTRT